ncbi:MAG: hypothetical protein IPG91_15465 [Ideonella sp.]|nr:hypothetical protein [Ideonella sp.]
MANPCRNRFHWRDKAKLAAAGVLARRGPWAPSTRSASRTCLRVAVLLLMMAGAVAIFHLGERQGTDRVRRDAT